jgi:predicted amidohydrolase YtcJ
VHLTHASGHASFANAKAMELAGVTRTTPNPSGGEILKDRNGNPIGIFRETASGLIQRAYAESRAKRTPEQIEAEDRRAAELAMRECLSKGVTTFHDAGVTFRTVDFYKKLVDEGNMHVRMWAMVRESNDELAAKLPSYRLIGYGDKRLTVRAIKKSIDGALGSRGAWLLEPYTDFPTSAGLNTIPIEDMRTTAELALQHGFQFCVHAIGDRANRETLDIYEEAFKDRPDHKELRWRIEHAQHLHPTDLGRFGQLGVIASVEGIHCTSDAPWVLARLGERRAEEGAYVWRKLMESGALIMNGTDAPVEDVNPILSFYASVSRKLKDGSVFYPSQRMTREEALRSYTINGAYGGFEEKEKGSITPGKLADIVVLSKDIMTIEEDEIPSTQVLYTIVGGKVMFQR